MNETQFHTSLMKKIFQLIDSTYLKGVSPEFSFDFLKEGIDGIQLR
jgi:hypothetical protein